MVFLKKNIFFLVLIFSYIAIELWFLNWGIPNPHHPFNYHMDEWHQSQAVRTVFTKGTPNIAGSANGSMLHFFLTGIYLTPFIIFGIVNPFAIKSSIGNLEMQQRLFEVFRLNTLFFGILSIILLIYIAKKYFKLNKALVTFLFVFNPMWLTLSGYFKYDIALVFWILVGFLFILKFVCNPNTRNYIIAGAASALSFAVKLSAIPLLPLYIFAFFAYFPSPLKNIAKLLKGVLIYILVFIVVGIPDLVLGRGNIYEYLDSNLRRAPDATSNFLLGSHYIPFLFFKLYAYTFGHALYFVFLVCGLGFFIWFLKKSHFKNPANFMKAILKNREYTLLFVTFILFLFSLLPLKIEGRANRLLVLLPFIVLYTSFFLTKIYSFIKNKKNKVLFIGIITLLIGLQLFEVFGWLWIKQAPDPRVTSSVWLQQHIKKETTIGIENIPIYQMLPDIVVKEFYDKQYGLKGNYHFNYQIVDSKSSQFPHYIIVTNDKVEPQYLQKSEKKDLIARLQKEKYKVVARFMPDLQYYNLYGNQFIFFIAGLVIAPNTITVYAKH